MIQEILSNTILLGDLRVDNFTAKEKAIASTFAKSAYDLCYNNGGMTRAELLDLLDELDIWSSSDEEQMRLDIDRLNSVKADYYDNFNIPANKKKLRNEIEKIIDSVNSKVARRSILIEFTCEYASDEAFFSYLVRDLNRPIFLYRKYSEWKLPEDKIRDLYFDPLWTTVWSSSKDPFSIFGIPTNQLNDNQLSLIHWSKIYDNIQQAEDPPSSFVLKDTFAVDGWMVKYNAKKSDYGKMHNLPVDAQEIFLTATSKEDARAIMKLNSDEGKSIINSRKKDLSINAELREQDFSFVKRERKMKINELNSRRK